MSQVPCQIHNPTLGGWPRTAHGQKRKLRPGEAELPAANPVHVTLTKGFERLWVAGLGPDPGSPDLLDFQVQALTYLSHTALLYKWFGISKKIQSPLGMSWALNSLYF